MILLFGMGKSNNSILNFFKQNNIKYITYDDNYNKCCSLDNIKLIIKSNGINNDHYIIKEAKKKNIKIISDLQLYFLLSNNNNQILVTGSNGKTTTVSILEKCLFNSIAIGNNGNALFDYINDKRFKIVEASSFMLEYANNINFKFNIITNIYNTHLEYHKSYIKYLKAKLGFLKNLSQNNYIIYNHDDLLLERIVNVYECKKIKVSMNKNDDLYFDNKYIYYKYKKILNIKKIKLIGKHYIYDVMYCLAVILNLNKNFKFKKEIYKFHGVEYRMNLVYNNKIKIYNDSKSTNFKALSAAISSFNGNIDLICGGMNRVDDFNILKPYINKIRNVYCYGENKGQFFNFFKNNNVNVYVYDDLKQLIDNLKIKNIKILLFSPGSCSYDQFDNFEQRGKIFNELIHKKIKS